MGDNNEEVSLTDIVVPQPTVAEQNELIMQLIQQVAEMRVEMQRRKDLPLLDLLLIVLMEGLQSTSLPQIWIQLRISHLHLFIIYRLEI